MFSLSFKCQAISNYIIETINIHNDNKSFSEQITLTLKKLQKLLYFCDIEYMKQNDGKPLFDDDFYAWSSGPILPAINSQFVYYSDGGVAPRRSCSRFEISRDISDIVNTVLEKTCHLDSIDLDNLTKIVGGPWSYVYLSNSAGNMNIIPKELIYSFYLNRDYIQAERNNLLVKKKKKNLHDN